MTMSLIALDRGQRLRLAECLRDLADQLDQISTPAPAPVLRGRESTIPSGVPYPRIDDPDMGRACTAHVDAPTSVGCGTPGPSTREDRTP